MKHLFSNIHESPPGLPGPSLRHKRALTFSRGDHQGTLIIVVHLVGERVWAMGGFMAMCLVWLRMQNGLFTRRSLEGSWSFPSRDRGPWREPREFSCIFRYFGWFWSPWAPWAFSWSNINLRNPRILRILRILSNCCVEVGIQWVFFVALQHHVLFVNGFFVWNHCCRSLLT